MAQACATGTGERTVLPLAAAVRNAGAGPLVLAAEDFGTARCGGAPALRDFLRWRVLDGSGAVAREGSADLGCLADGTRAAADAPGQARFTCPDAPGLQAGWSDGSDAAAGCTFADLTGLAAGDYELELTVNAAGTVEEARLDNNTARVPLHIPQVSCEGSICGGRCCPQGIGCNGDKCAMPDLTIDELSLVQSIRVDEANFAGDDCAVEEGCVEATGLRRLLRFTLATPNVGGADLVVGDPTQTSQAAWSACHEHYHMTAFANYRLLRPDGSVAATGHKQAFCLMDTEVVNNEGPTAPRYDCDYQGISQGWSDSYGSGLDCQWVDVTGVPEGDYVLEVVVNGQQRYPESDYTNNAVQVPVFLPADPSQCVPREEVCGDGRDQDCDGEPDDGCAPLAANDSCAEAWLLDGSGTWTGAIDGETAGDGGGSCGGGGGTLHFTLTVLSEEIVYLSTYGSAIDTVLRVEEGRCGEKTEAFCGDDGCGLNGSHFAGVLPAGTYDVIVQARDPGATGEVKLNVQRSGCTGARFVDAPGSYYGDTTGAGRDTMTACGLGGGPDELWVFATCPGTTEVILSTCDETSFDTVLEVRKGSCRGATEGCSDDGIGAMCGAPSGSRLDGPLHGEGLWFVVVDGYLATDAGPYRFDVSW